MQKVGRNAVASRLPPRSSWRVQTALLCHDHRKGQLLQKFRLRPDRGNNRTTKHCNVSKQVSRFKALLSGV